MQVLKVLWALFFSLGQIAAATAQQTDDPLRIATVTRPPFSMVVDGQDTGFSIDLLRALAADTGRTFTLVRTESFSEMLSLVATGEVDAATANISITASREQIMDFSQPIFSAGLQIMAREDGAAGLALWRAVFSAELLAALLAAFALLLGGGMLMWRFERKHQGYFDTDAREAMFPAFWWALNLVVNGGFEERVPRSAFGRIFGVFLVISSLFVVSVFVARITSVMTVEAIQSSVSSINDLYGKRIGTIGGSTADTYLDRREMSPQRFADLTTLLDGFESGQLDAVVFDAPVLAYYIATNPRTQGRLVGPVFVRENYGIALPSGSDLAEPLNQSLLKLREDGTYDSLYRDWFGNNPGSR